MALPTCHRAHNTILPALPTSLTLCPLPLALSNSALNHLLFAVFPSNLCGSHPRWGAHIEVGDTPVNLSPVAVGSGGRCGRWQAAVGDGARVPVGPIDTAGLDMDIHGIDTDTLVTLEGLLVSRMGVTGEQAADLIVVGDVEDLILRAWTGKRPGVG